MDETRWQDVERERLSLADLLDSLTSAQWETQSLCERWRVRDVAAHVAMSPVPEPSMSTLVAALVRAHGHLWEAAAAIAVDYAQRPTEEIAAGLRRVAASRAVPRVTNPDNLLMDLLVHGQDITIPLGIERPMPTDAAVAGFRRVWSMGWPFHARRRMRGMHLIATDAPVDVGDPDGARVQGRLGDLLLLITGRADPALDRLDGEGTARLRSIPRPSGGTR
ncbi:MAG: maleylpyruvate isomerase family mycothiol-dependent enzyme [Actinobacteria bacterium]|jgi:uncharacterized protein (TIGR03083 family)|nr:maleylpyruvate isomerase family mycothiol-dependent enzyme [Phycicoccus elongatus]MBK8729748.1 maleylpyruvate isomerase family mycothiol-dependent enzyme [Tetrasphaera sp.]MCA0321599.1 maleylpyruvate isomerase family mycothiol-dependent enzyme [Actinomycetota bacterium]